MDLCQIWASYLRNFHNLYFLHCLFSSILVLAWPPLPLCHQKHFASACPRIGIPAPTLSVFSNSQRLKVGTANIVRAVKSSKCSTPALDIWDRGPQGYCRPLNDFRTKWPKTPSKNKKLQTLLHFFSSNLVNDDLMFFSFFPSNYSGWSGICHQICAFNAFNRLSCAHLQLNGLFRSKQDFDYGDDETDDDDDSDGDDDDGVDDYCFQRQMASRQM